MRKPAFLTLVEATALGVWLALAAVLVARDDTGGDLAPIDPEALAAGHAEESWMGVYYQGQKVGYAVSSRSPTAEGGTLLRNRSAFRLAAFGEIKQVVTVGNAVLGGDGKLRAFDFFMSSDPVRLTARGEVRPGEIVVEILQGGEVQTLRLPIADPPQLNQTLGAWIAAVPEIRVGDEYRLPYFDVVTLTQQDMVVRVVDVEVFPSGEEAFWIERRVGDISTRMLVTPAGETLREEGALGMAMVRETPEQAQALPADAEPVDLIALSAVKLEGGFLADARTRGVLELQILGVDPDRVRHDPPNQVREGDRVRVVSRLWAEVPAGLPIREEDLALAPMLAGTPLLPVDHREIRGKAAEVLAGATDRGQAARALNDWVHRYLRKAPTLSVPNALEVLRTGQGDCNEHTALFVALARTAGIPARIAAGVVWSDRVGGGAFYYHAWPEVFMGSAGWFPLDPTLGQAPADATHVKLVEGDLDRQVEIMAVMGRLGFRLVSPPGE